MYLKSIEVNGFKSFANKILFEFHDGITVIVGPNGSGKSNVADAVRWVLGEQSAKQLRGVNMQDVIFSGSEARKPLSYAYVEITFDNCDHKLPIDFDEVSVARRVYRSGESEYLINQNTCRLRDVQELFMDTGIGKEGYSIIGQGQIDKILSTKPEDRRELFDEAAGIVKFKKRKAIAEKNLIDAQDNLARITDIAGELEKQLGPLEKQSVTAREYLRLKEILKRLEVNAFLFEYGKSETTKTALVEKCDGVNAELAETRSSYENAETEYKRLETTLEDYNAALEEGRSFKSDLLLAIEKGEGQIKLFEQQLLAIEQNSSRIDERIEAILSEIAGKENEISLFRNEKDKQSEKLKELNEKSAKAADELEKIKLDIEKLTSNVEEANRSIIDLMNNSAGVKTNIERAETVLETINVRHAEIVQKLIVNKSEHEEANALIKDYKTALEEVTLKIENGNELINDLLGKLREADEESHRLIDIYDGTQQSFIGEKSRLESLKDIAEHYEGYGNGVKKVMEVKDKYPGVNGVVADLISVDKKYETAVEIALGASIQHVVTDDEQTAKALIEYLKAGKLGRATFLPVTSVGRNKNTNDDKVMKEKGVISDAASLVTYDAKYAKIVDHLLKAFIVVDNVDNALALAKKYDYSLRIVTLSGEQLAPGGSIAGGAFRNNGNLLGRKREITDIEAKLEKLEHELASVKARQQAVSDKKKEIRNELDKAREDLRMLSVEQTEAKLKLEKEQQHVKDIAEKASSYEDENKASEQKMLELRNELKQLRAKLDTNDKDRTDYNEKISEYSGRLTELKFTEGTALEKVNQIRLEAQSVEQAGQYDEANIQRIISEVAKLKDEKKLIEESRDSSESEATQKKKEISDNTTEIAKNRNKIAELEKHIEELIDKKESLTREHKNFFDSWGELGKRVTELEKEALRLSNQREKLEEQIDGQISYIWDEYELTVSTAEEYRDPEFRSSTARKEIADTRGQIKSLGDVNVNSIEEFKNVSERFKLLAAQRDDLMVSQDSIKHIIEELDTEMRKQFASQFELIAKEFNSVFRELFGGGKGELELVEDEDMLEAGIRIIAQPPGKKLQNMMQLSGGEKALTAIALLFAIQNLKPSPFCLLDEIEAALDDSNVKRFASYLKKLTKNSQFIVITHRRGTMASADILYGITMQEKGVSTLVSVSLIESNLSN